MTWIMTYTGKKVDFVNPDMSQLYDIEDVTHALSKIERFTGHGKEEYTVGLHTLLGTNYMDDSGQFNDRETFLFFIHDFPEYVLNDISSPLKQLLPDYIKIEKKFEGLLYEKFNIAPPTVDEKKIVKEIDMLMFANEARALMLHPEEFGVKLDYSINFHNPPLHNKQQVANYLKNIHAYYMLGKKSL